MNRPLRPVDLNVHDVYLTPLGRRCILKPQPEDGRWGKYFFFTYLGGLGGFSLTSANVRILRKGA